MKVNAYRQLLPQSSSDFETACLIAAVHTKPSRDLIAEFPQTRTRKRLTRLVTRATDYSDMLNFRAAGIPLRTVAEYSRLQDKADDILAEYNTGYSMGDSKALLIGYKVFARRDDTELYARSCKWAPTHGHVSIKLTLNQLRKIERIQGIWTIRGKNNRATWLEDSGSKGDYQVHFVRGYIVGDSHAETLAEARQVNAIRTRTHSDSGERAVSVRTLQRVGACKPGIQQAVKRLGINRNVERRVTTSTAILKLARKHNMEQLCTQWVFRIPG